MTNVAGSRDSADDELAGSPSVREGAIPHVAVARGRAEAEGAALDPRILAAWREWLAALATNAEAALAAAHVYADLTPAARVAWLDALAEDAPRLDVPRVAIYAPLLWVEMDPDRRTRISSCIGDDATLLRRRPFAALRGFADDGARVVALVSPLYLSFVRTLWCRYLPDVGFAWARHDAILNASDAPKDGVIVDHVTLEATPVQLVIEELAHAVLAHGRKGSTLPSSLRHFVDLFDAHVEGETLP
jgi:hypothetical protein